MPFNACEIERPAACRMNCHSYLSQKESKILPALFVTLLADLDRKIEPKIIAPMTRIVNKHAGMTYIFLRYQWRLENVIESPYQKYS